MASCNEIKQQVSQILNKKYLQYKNHADGSLCGVLYFLLRKDIVHKSATQRKHHAYSAAGYIIFTLST